MTGTTSRLRRTLEVVRFSYTDEPPARRRGLSICPANLEAGLYLPSFRLGVSARPDQGGLALFLLA